MIVVYGEWGVKLGGNALRLRYEQAEAGGNTLRSGEKCARLVGSTSRSVENAPIPGERYAKSVEKQTSQENTPKPVEKHAKTGRGISRCDGRLIYR